MLFIVKHKGARKRKDRKESQETPNIVKTEPFSREKALPPMVHNEVSDTFPQEERKRIWKPLQEKMYYEIQKGKVAKDTYGLKQEF